MTISEQTPQEQPRHVAGMPAAKASSSAILPPGSPVQDKEPSSRLTPEEQMELYEKSLKETDWGHQPC
jgi:hypothetical protein